MPSRLVGPQRPGGIGAGGEKRRRQAGQDSQPHDERAHAEERQRVVRRHRAVAGCGDDQRSHEAHASRGEEQAERGNPIGPYILARSAAQKIAAIHALPDAPAAPGTEFAYYSTHSFVLSQAMNNYVRAREGPQADYWTLVQQDVLTPIGVPLLPVSRSIESDGSLGIPVMGWGGYPEVDAAARVAQLLQDDGAHGGRQLLSRTKTREAMRRAGHPGYATGNSAERYLHSVWTVRTDTGACTIDVPLMSGHGGNHVLPRPWPGRNPAPSPDRQTSA